MTESEAGYSSLHHGLRVLRRRWWLVALLTVAVGAAAYELAQRQAKEYSSTAAVLIAQPDVPSSAGSSNLQATLATQSDLARVPQIAWQVLVHSGLQSTMTVGGFLAHSSVATTPNSNVVNLTVTDAAPQLAQRLATAYAQQFIVYRNALANHAIEKSRLDVERQLRALKAGGDTTSVLYTSLLTEDAQLRTMQSLQSSNSTVVQNGSAAVQIQPRPTRDALLGVGLGLVLGLGLVFLLEAVDTRVRSAEEIRDRLDLPLLGLVPPPPRGSSHRPPMLADPRGPYQESLRTLRTTFSLAAVERRARVIGVTSALRQEGKSTTASNLAVALASGGFSVVLVDLDLHRPRVHELFGLPQGPGLTDVALGLATLDDALHRIPLPPRRSRTVIGRNGNASPGHGGALEVLTSGPIPPDAGEFVGTETVHDIVAAVAERADLVLVDTPPLLGVGDALAVSPSLDAVLAVMRLGALRRPALTEFRRKLDEFPVDKIGFVLTAADSDESFSYYRLPYKGHALGRRPKRLKEPIA